MRNGQIGTEHQPRVIFIWEGAVAVLPDSHVIRTLEWTARHTGQNDHALSYWKIQTHALNLMWSLLARTPYRIDMCVTTRPPEFAKAVAHKVEVENWPVSYVFAAAPQELGRRLPYSPDAERVYYGLESQRWAYGPQGYFLSRDHPITVS